MSLVAVTTLGVGLSMDAFAAALGQGAASPQHYRRHALMVAALFGLAQAAMPFIGWMLGAYFHESFQHIDHWIAFGLLGFLGASMLYAAWQPQETPSIASGWRLVALALATSIDAAAAGLTLAVLGMPILLACAVIGLITFSLSYAGAYLGRLASTRLGSIAEIAGGVILIVLGCKILLEHLA